MFRFVPALIKIRVVIFLGLFLLTLPCTFGIDPEDYAVQAWCTAQLSPPALSFSWPESGFARVYRIRRKLPADTDWGPAVELPGNATGYVDTQVSVGAAYEYEIELETSLPSLDGGWINAYSYLYAGVQAVLSDAKGKTLLVVDSSVATALDSDLATFSQDLVAAGYIVVRRNVDRSSPVSNVKALIRAEYDSDPANFRSVILVGHVPVPYSGNIAPDLHESHKGAWPADVYYADMDGSWTDSTVSVTSEDYPENDNFPGDGKFDQSEIPSRIKIELGRIDFWDMPSFAPRSEVDLLRNYLRKDHAFRNRQFTAGRRMLVHDNFGDLDGDAPAVDAWRHFAAFFGPGTLQETGPDTFFSVLNGNSYLWAYGCGGGGMTKADGVGSTTDFAAGDPKAVFVILHGSYFGDWNVTDNFLRAAIATPSTTLASIWSGIPHWYLHHMALGASVGFSTRVTQNNVSTYKSYRNFAPHQVHISLLGDPTLEMFPVVPPSNLSAVGSESVALSWTPSSDENLVGYHVYYAKNSEGPYTRITSIPVTGTTFNHAVPAGTYYYMVRAIKLEKTGSGSFLNASQGITTVASSGGGGTQIPTVNASVLDPDASERGPKTGVFLVTRNPVAGTPLTVNLIIAGIAVNGVDYVQVPLTVTIPAGSASAQIPITPISDGIAESSETVTLQFSPSSSYIIGSSPSAVLFIKDEIANQPPAIGAIPNQMIPPNTSTTDILFRISDSDTPLDNITLRAVSSNPDVIPDSNISLGGSGANRTIRISSGNQTGTAIIQLILSDGLNEVRSSFSVTVSSENLRPSADPQSLTTPEDIPLIITLTGTDPEKSPLQFNVRRAPNLGVLTGSLPNIVYTPNPNVSGADSFTFTVSDGELDSAEAMIRIIITPVNDAPVAVAQQIQTDQNVPVAITLQAQDSDSNQFDFRIVEPPKLGVLTDEGALLTYTPNRDAIGTDSFAFVANDWSTDSAPATVSITILKGNTSPVAQSFTVSAPQGGATSIMLKAEDDPGQALQYAIVSGPTNGVLTGSAPAVIYTPNPGYVGSDSFTYKANDGKLDSNLATVSINVAPAIPPKITSVRLQGGTAIALDLVGPPSRSFIVLSSTDATTWTTEGEGSTDTSGKATFVHGETGRMKFFRVEWP